MRDKSSVCVKKIPFIYVVMKNRHSSLALFKQTSNIIGTFVHITQASTNCFHFHVTQEYHPLSFMAITLQPYLFFSFKKEHTFQIITLDEILWFNINEQHFIKPNFLYSHTDFSVNLMAFWGRQLHSSQGVVLFPACLCAFFI